MPDQKQYNSYIEILKAPTGEFIDYIYEFIPNVEINIQDPVSMQSASERMMAISNLIVFLSELEARAGLYKRELKWSADESKDSQEKKQKKKLYEDMVDKEKIINKAIHSLEIQYRAINRSLTVCLDGMKDQFMPGTVRRK